MELQMHNITTMDKARCKAKITKNFGSPVTKEGKCRYCGDKWSSGHKCSNKKSYKYEAERESNTSINNSNEEEKRRKIIVVDVVRIGFQVIDVHPITYIIAKL
jgi:hypothetical protein